MLRGYAFCAISLVIGTSLFSNEGVKGEDITGNIEYSKSEKPKNDANLNNEYVVSTMNQDALNEKKQVLLSYGQVINVKSNLCVRKEPDINSEIKAVLKNGMTFEILSKTYKWYEIKYNLSLIHI
eukprot:TRINITY_DN23639_c0_g1_i1.p2 TRINITY_DN23639_c0_g1~~TRINITY_DN23639_c0_g1_i1.p2  ORF type:complete len:125 (-),score=10.52 TRINITY_DN23639_c0_g1_i1:53-427(-)